MTKCKKMVNRVVLEVFRIFAWFSTIAYLTIEGVNVRWVGAAYKFLVQGLFTLLERAPVHFISNGMRTIENYVMWVFEKFSFQELGLLFVAAIVSKLAVRLVIECDMLFHRARVMRKRRQQAKQQKVVDEINQTAFYARNAVSMTNVGALGTINNPQKK